MAEFCFKLTINIILSGLMIICNDLSGFDYIFVILYFQCYAAVEFAKLDVF